MLNDDIVWKEPKNNQIEAVIGSLRITYHKSPPCHCMTAQQQQQQKL